MGKFLPFILVYNVCEQNGLLKAVQILGFVLNILKVVVPILLIVFGTYELGKAVLSNDDKAIKVAVSSLVKKAIAGVAIFFIPTIIAFVMSLIDDVNRVTRFDCLTECLTTPKNCTMPENDGILQ